MTNYLEFRRAIMEDVLKDLIKQFMPFAQKQRDKRKRSKMAMASAQMPQTARSSMAATGANEMQRMMMGGMMKRSKPIDGLATKGKTKGSMR